MPFKGDFLFPPSAPCPEPWLGLVGSFPNACLLPHPHLQFILLLLRDLLSKSWIGTWQSFASKAFLTLSTYRLGFLFLSLALACKSPPHIVICPQAFRASLPLLFISSHTPSCFSHMNLSPQAGLRALCLWSRGCLCLAGLSPILHLSSSSFFFKFTLNPSSTEPF